MPTQLRLDGVLAKIEATYGTDAAPVFGTDGVRVLERVWSASGYEHAFANERAAASNASLIELQPAQPAGRIRNFQLTWDARGTGAAYTDPTTLEASPLLRACGLGETIVTTASSESVTYAPIDTGLESCTIWIYAGGMLFKYVGCVGTVSVPATPGISSRMVFDMSGIMVVNPAAAALPAIVYDATTPPLAVNMALDVGSGAFSPEGSFGLELGGNVVRLDGVNPTEGVERFAVTGFTPVVTITSRAVALGTYDPYADNRARTVRTIDAVWGSTQYNRFDLAIVDGQLLDPTHEDDNEFAAYALRYQCADLAIKFD